MKNLLRTAICRSARNRAVYRSLWHPLSRITQLAVRERQRVELGGGSEASEFTPEILKDLRVRKGPFEGLKYPNAAAVGSALLPKLIGSYEQELHGVVEEAVDRKPIVVVDIGCAEGYYANGFALRLPSVPVYAFDTLASARQSCMRMAEVNELNDRVVVKGRCNAADLVALAGEAGLIWSDCEGFEATLFTAETIEALRHSDLLIETHDFIAPFTTERLESQFRKTHYVRTIRSLPDSLRPEYFRNAAILDAPYNAQVHIMAEHRPAEMQWLWCTSHYR